MNRAHGTAEQLLREGVDDPVYIFRRHHMVDESDFLGFLRQQESARHEVLLGPGMADEMRPDDRAAVAGRKADLDMGVADFRRGNGEYHIT